MTAVPKFEPAPLQCHRCTKTTHFIATQVGSPGGSRGIADQHDVDSTVRSRRKTSVVNTMHPLHDALWIFRRADLDDPVFRERFEKRVNGKVAARPDSRQLDLTIPTTYRGEAV